MFFTSDDEVGALAGAFYARTLPLSKWTKAAQLAVALYYAISFPNSMAHEIVSDRVKSMWAGRLSASEESDIEASVADWLASARSFADTYRNIEDLSALANIFIATHWETKDPFPRHRDEALLDADTARLSYFHDPDLDDTIEISFQPSLSQAMV